VLKQDGIVTNAEVNKSQCTGVQSNCIQGVHIFLRAVNSVPSILASVRAPGVE